VQWKTGVGKLRNLHVGTSGEFEMYRDLYSIPFGNVFVQIVLCVCVLVSCVSGHIFWDFF
jgi:hypothetical protein